MQPSNTLDSVAGDDGGNVDDKGNVGSIVIVVLLLLFFLAVGTAFVKVLRQRRKRKQGKRTNTMHLQEGWAGESTTDGPETVNPYLMVSPDDVNNYVSVSPPVLTETSIDHALGFLTELKDDEARIDRGSAARDSLNAARGKRRSRKGPDSQPDATSMSRQEALALATVNAAMDKDLLSFSDAMAGVTPAYMDVMPDVTPGAQEIYGGLIGAVSDPIDCITTPTLSRTARSSAGPTLRRLDEMPERQQRPMTNPPSSRPHSSMTAACEERKPRLTTNAWGHVEQVF